MWLHAQYAIYAADAWNVQGKRGLGEVTCLRPLKLQKVATRLGMRCVDRRVLLLGEFEGVRITNSGYFMHAAAAKGRRGWSVSSRVQPLVEDEQDARCILSQVKTAVGCFFATYYLQPPLPCDQ